MGDSNTNQSTGNVEAVTALTNAATIRKLLRLPNEEGKTNFEILEVRSISDLANGHNCEVTIRVDLAFGHEGLPVPENERYSVRTETVRRIDLKDVAKLAGLELNDKQQYIGAATDVEAVSALLKAKLTEDDITISPIKDVMWVRTKPDSVGFIGMLTFAEGGESGEKLPTSITAALSAAEVQTTVSITAVAAPVRSISVYVDSPDFAVGDQVQYSVDVLPFESVDKTYTITSTNEAILKVNPNRTVTALAVGTAGIKHTSNANPSVESNVLEITVHPAVTSLTFTNPSEIQENSGEISLGLTVDRTPTTATVGDVTYTVVETSSGVDAEITAGSTLTAIGLVVGSTIKVRATISRGNGEGFNTVTADQTITITGSM